MLLKIEGDCTVVHLHIGHLQHHISHCFTTFRRISQADHSQDPLGNSLAACVTVRNLSSLALPLLSKSRCTERARSQLLAGIS